MNQEKRKVQSIGLSFSTEVQDLIIAPYRKEEGMRLYLGQGVDPIKTRIKEIAYDLKDLHIQQQLILTEFLLDWNLGGYRKQKAVIAGAMERHKTQLHYLNVLMGDEPDIDQTIGSLEKKLSVLFQYERKIVTHFSELDGINRGLSNANERLLHYCKAFSTEILSEISYAEKLNRNLSWALLIAILFGLSFLGTMLARDIIRFVDALEESRENHRISKERLKAVTDNIPGVVFQFRSTRNHVYSSEFLSQKTTELFSLDPDSNAFVNEFYDHIPDDEKERYLNSIRESVDRVQPWNYEGRFIKPDGKTIWFSGASVPQEEGESIVFYGVLMDITQRRQMEEALRFTQFTFDKAALGIHYVGSDGRILKMNAHAAKMLGYGLEEVTELTLFDIDPLMTDETMHFMWDRMVLESTDIFERVHIKKDGSRIPVEIASNFFEYEGRQFSVCFVQDITERKRIEEALEKRIEALTQPLGDEQGIAFKNLFDLSDIQYLQDLYAEAFGVAALITYPDGTPITQPSNFTVLCSEFIRNTEKGAENCKHSDAMIGRHNPAGPNIQPCLSAGLCNAGASITVGGHHIANWLIGQVRNKTQKEEDIMHYARELGADETAFRAAYHQVPTMSEAQFEKVALVLFAVANQLSTSAYQNVQQARFIAEKKRTEESLRLSKFIFDNAPIGIWRMGKAGEVLDVNEKGCASLDYSREELCRMLVFDFTSGFYKEDWEEVSGVLYETGSVTLETLLQRKSGEIFPVQVTSTLMTFEGRDYNVAFVQDITERKQMEEALKESQERLDLALSGANEGIWDWNVKEKAVYFDPRYYTMAGYEPDEFPGAFEEWERRVHEDDLERVKSGIGQYMAGDLETYMAEFRFLQKDGDYMWIQAKGKIVARDDQGIPVRFIGTHADITDRKQAEEALRENQQLLGNILESMNDFVAVLDPEFTYQLVNTKYEELTGKLRQELIGKTPWMLFPGLKNTDVEAVLQSAMKGDAIIGIESQLNFLGKKASWLRGSYSPLKDSDGRVMGVVFLGSDITRQKKNEEELRHLRNYLSNIINSMPSILVAVDRDGNVTQWNSQTEQATGVSFESACSQPLAKVFPRLADEMVRIRTAIRERRVITCPKVTRKIEQEIHFEDITIYPLVANGVEGAVIRVDDVTEQIRLEEMMIQSEKMLSVGGLAAGMAHEINNPLAGMIQTAGVMANRLGTNLHIPANQKAAEEAGTTMEAIEKFMKARSIPRMLATINESGQRVAAIVDNMLSFARKSDSTVSTHVFDEILDKTTELAATDYDLKKQFDFKRIEIQREYADPPVSAPCEGAKIQQVLLNILRNGAQAMQAAGAETPRFIFRTLFEQDRKMAVMEIEDSGPGMDEQTRKRVFEPFFTTKPVGVGTGLGLSVSYFIITENHGGEMLVTSAPGKGSTFIIKLPTTRKTL